MNADERRYERARAVAWKAADSRFCVSASLREFSFSDLRSSAFVCGYGLFLTNRPLSKEAVSCV